VCSLMDQALEPNLQPRFTPSGRGMLGVKNELFVILVVEDDALVQESVQDALSDGGFETAITSSGEEAVTLLQGDRTRYRALITNVVLLGRLDGWEVAHRAREVKPDIPVIYMTGTAANEWSANGVPNSILFSRSHPLSL
jgi:CheY-like chemotaxis protein